MNNTAEENVARQHNQTALKPQNSATSTSGNPTNKVMDQLDKVRDIQDFSNLQNAVMAVNMVTYHWDIDSDKITWGGALKSMFGSLDETDYDTGRGFATITGKKWLRWDTVMKSSQMDSGSGVAFNIEYQLYDDDDDHSGVWVEDCGRWYADKSGNPSHVLGVIRRIDERYDRDQKLRVLSRCDALTGMVNRSRLMQLLDENIGKLKADDCQTCFMVAAVSNLPVINDAYGYDVADDVVAAVAKRLQSVVREKDLIGRISGGKFGVILNLNEGDDIAVAAERLLGVSRESVIQTERGPVWAMLSIGGVLLPDHAEKAEIAMARAEEALAEAQRQPTDSFVQFELSLDRISLRSLNAKCASEIVSSLRGNRFRLAYQPIVDAITLKPVLHEALLRMECEDGDTVGAHHLIPVAEKLGLIRLIDQNVLNMVMQQLRDQPQARIGFNVSGITATDLRWFEKMTRQLKENPELARRSVVEITETMILNDLNETVRFIDELREVGCQIAIDDFGAGYTSFRNLKVMNVDLVKIDGSFCENLSQNDDNQYFVRSLVDLAKKFNLKIVAEWVEAKEDAELLSRWGVDYLQGNLFGAAKICDPWSESGDAVQSTICAPAEVKAIVNSDAALVKLPSTQAVIAETIVPEAEKISEPTVEIVEEVAETVVTEPMVETAEMMAPETVVMATEEIVTEAKSEPKIEAVNVEIDVDGLDMATPEAMNDQIFTQNQDDTVVRDSEVNAQVVDAVDYNQPLDFGRLHDALKRLDVVKAPAVK